MQLDLVITTLGTFLLVCAVIGANPTRSQNQAFTFLGLLSLGWLITIQLAFAGTDVRWISLWISLCSAFAGFVPAAVMVLRATIRGLTLSQALWQMKWWLLTAAAIAVYCLTPLYIAGAALPQDSASIPEHLPGSAFFIYPLYMMGALAIAFVLSLRDALVMREIARVESGFLAAAIAAQVFIGIILSSTIPYFVGSFQSTRFSYIWVLSMVVIAAYGISANRLLSPGRVLQQTCSYLIVATLVGGLYIVFRLLGESMLGIHHETLLGLLPGLAVMLAIFFFGKSMLRWAHHLTSMFQRRMDVSRMIASLNLSGSRVSSLEDLTRKIESVLAEGTGSMGVTLFHRDGDSFQGTWNGAVLTLETCDVLLEHLVSTRQPLSADLLKRKGHSVAEREILERMLQLNISAAIPVAGEDGVMGILALEPRYTGEIYEADELEELGILASHLSVALDNARLFSEILQEREQSARLAESINHGLIACDRQGQIIQYNRKAREILTGERGPTIHEIPQELCRLLQDALKGHTCRKERIEVAGCHLLADSGRYQGQDGAELGAFLMLEDITERVALEGKLAQLSHQVHDMKVPMSSIRIFAELLPEKFNDDEFRNEFGPVIVNEVNRLDGILREMGRRGSESDGVMERDLAAIAHQEISHLSKVAKAEGITLHWSRPSESIRLALSETDATRLIVNPIQNAIDSLAGAQREGQVWIQLVSRHRDGSEQIRFEVEDDGPGMPAELRRQVFDSGFSTRLAAGGSGLGLSQVASITDHLGAEVNFTASRRGGAHFIWTLNQPAEG